MPLVEPPVSARTDRHDRPIAAMALASRHLCHAAHSLFAELTSLVSRWGVRCSGPCSAKCTTATRVQAGEASDAAG